MQSAMRPPTCSSFFSAHLLQMKKNEGRRVSHGLPLVQQSCPIWRRPLRPQNSSLLVHALFVLTAGVSLCDMDNV